MSSGIIRAADTIYWGRYRSDCAACKVIRGHQRSSEVIRGHIATWVEHRHELEHEGVAQRTRAWIELIEDEAQEALHAMRELIRDAIREATR